MRALRRPVSFPALAALFVFGGAAAGCGGEPQPNAIAITEEDGSLAVIAGTVGRTCDNLDEQLIDCGLWELLVHVEPEGLAAGGALPLSSPSTWAENLFADGRVGARDCLVVGGTFELGTIEILARDQVRVRYRIEGTEKGLFDDADGVYDAVPCP